MTHFLPKSLFLRLASALVLCAMIPAAGANAKDIDNQPNSSEAAPAGSDTLKTRQIAVEPVSAEQSPLKAKTAETAEPAPAPKAPAAPLEGPAAAGEDDDAAPAPEEEQRSEPETSPKIEHGNAYAYVLRYRAAHGHGYHRYQPVDGYGHDDYRPAGYGGGHRYQHCD